MAVWRDGVSLTVEIAFATAPQATPTWVDVTDYVRDVPNVSRGRTDEFGAFSPGTATVVLDNRDRRFDPDYAAGAYYPNVLPGKRIKITWAFAAASGVLFTGYILGWPQHETHPSDGWVTIPCVDGSRLLGQATLPSSAYVAEVLSDSPFAYWPLQDGNLENLAGVVQPDAVPLSILTDTYAAPTFVDIELPAGDSKAMKGPGQAYLGYLQLGGVPSSWSTKTVGTWEFWMNDTGGVGGGSVGTWLGASGSQQAGTFGVGQGSGEMTGYVIDETTSKESTTYPSAGSSLGLHHWVMTVSATRIKIYRDSIKVADDALGTITGGLSGNPLVDVVVSVSTLQISHVALYESVLTQAKIVDHYFAGLGYTPEKGGARIGRALDSAGWPSGLRDLDTGGTPQAAYRPASQTAINYLRDVEVSEHGMVFLDASGDVRFIDRQTIWKAANTATFSDDGAAGAIQYVGVVRGSSIDTIRNVVTVTPASGSVTSTDATSVTAYGEVRESIACPTMPTAELAASLADYVVREKATPGIVVSSLVAPLRVSGGDNEAETLLALEVGDRVTWERTPVGVSPQVVKTLIVQGLSHSISRDQWLVSLYLSPMPTSYIDAPYLTVADSTYGKIGATAGNLIPF